jgi:alpha-amylase
MGDIQPPSIQPTSTLSLADPAPSMAGAASPSPAVNGTMMQYFHWYLADDGRHWSIVADRAKELAQSGFTAMWLPPAYKGIGGGSDVGYGVYDIFDLGEFDQKGSVRTKYGTKDQYVAAVKALQASGIQVYADTVLNHRMGADATETPKATPFAQDDRNNPKGGLQEVKTYTHFQFPGRKGQHSTFEWHWYHFDGVDYNAYAPDDRGTVYLFEGKQFDGGVSGEKGSFAYLMGCDIDCQNEWVQGELIFWGKWYLDTIGVDGFRLDAIKHIGSWFFPLWLDALEKHAGKDLFTVGEYWQNNLEALQGYISAVGGRMSVFDVPLHYNFHAASKAFSGYDMRQILDGTLMKSDPMHAVTFVENHDSQPMQALESVVEPWFKPLAYALILLRAEGYPCVFYADYYGADYDDRGYHISMPSHRWLIDKFLKVRQEIAYGPQYDYFDHPNTIGWTRLGDDQHPKAMAVLLSNGRDGNKWMEVGAKNATFRDVTEHFKTPVKSNKDGWAQFFCQGGSVSVWVQD